MERGAERPVGSARVGQRVDGGELARAPQPRRGDAGLEVAVGRAPLAAQSERGARADGVPRTDRPSEDERRHDAREEPLGDGVEIGGHRSGLRHRRFDPAKGHEADRGGLEIDQRLLEHLLDRVGDRGLPGRRFEERGFERYERALLDGHGARALGDEEHLRPGQAEGLREDLGRHRGRDLVTGENVEPRVNLGEERPERDRFDTPRAPDEGAVVVNAIRT